jgi:hypothetical protein
MVTQVEISSFDLRYEGYRMRSAVAEKGLFFSISEKGIHHPLQGVDTRGARILLDGFKRYRCAKKLGIEIVPYCSLGEDEALGIMELIRISNAKSLSILEQAKLIDELKNVHKMSVGEIAGCLERSKAWVSVRCGIITEISPLVMDRVLRGQFPVYSYLYTLRSFIRINGIRKEDVDGFVESVSGKSLSIRDIDMLAHGYFKGTREFREQIANGDISWVLSRMKESSVALSGCSESEKGMLRDLEIVQKYMQRIRYKSKDSRFRSNGFFVQANLLSEGILRGFDGFKKAIEQLYDRSGQA